MPVSTSTTCSPPIRASSNTSPHQTGPAVLRGARRRVDDRGAGTRAAQRGPQLAPPRRRIRLRAGGGVQRRRGADRRAAQRQPAGGGDPPPLLATSRPATCRRSRSSSTPRSPTSSTTTSRPTSGPRSWPTRCRTAARTRSVPDDRDRGRGHRGPARPAFPPRLPRPRGRAGAAPVDPAGRRRALPHPVLQRAQGVQPPPTGVFHALPISQGKSIVNSHWIKDMVGFYGLDMFMAETSATCGGLDSLLSRPARCAKRSSWPPRPTGRGRASSSPTARRRRTRSSRSRWSPPATSCCSTATATSRTTTG